MILLKIIIYYFLFFLSFEVKSFNLKDKLNIFLQKEYCFNKNNINLIIKTPLKKHMDCKQPFFSLLNNFHSLGLINVLLNCKSQYQYLKVELQVEGKYVIANKKILRGTKIQESDLKILTGRLDKLPNNTYLDIKDVINKVNIRDIYPFQPITSFMTRPFWIITINQKVNLIIKGINFKIISQGKSLINATINERIRVKTNSGKILSGIVNKHGDVIIKP